MCGSGAPAAPDPYAVSAAQTASNNATAEKQSALNAVNQYNPYGSSTFTRDANGDPTGQTMSLSAPLQGLLSGQEGIGSGLQGTAGSLMGNLPTSGVNTNFGNQVNQAVNGAFQSTMGLLNPQFALQNTNLNTTLTDRGLPFGGDAWNNATAAQQLTQDQATNAAAGQAVGVGNQEQAQLFGQSLAANQLPYQELQQVLGMSPTSSLLSSAPNATYSPSTISPTNVSGNVYQSYQDQLNAYNQQMNNLTTGALGVGALAMSPTGSSALSSLGSLLFASCEDFKEDRVPASGEASLMKLAALPVDHYRYKDGAQAALGTPEHRTGPMAGDVAKHFPDASNGVMVDLPSLLGHTMSAVQALNERTKHLAPRHSHHEAPRENPRASSRSFA